MAIFAHLGAFVAPVLLACLIFATTKDSTVKKAAAQALGFQLLSAVSFVAAMMLPVVGLVLLGLSNPRSMGERTAMLVGVLPILGTGIVAVLSIWGAIAAALRIHRGETWRMPVFGGLIETITRTRD